MVSGRLEREVWWNRLPACYSFVIQNSAKHLDYVKGEVVAATNCDIPAVAIEKAIPKERE